MRKKILLTSAIILTFILGYSINNIAISNSENDAKIAVVDVQQIVANSSKVKDLKKEQDIKLKAMQETINKAQAEISKESDSAKISALEEKYRKQINDQKLAMDYEYNSKLTQIDNDIKTAVIEKAQEMHYNIVFPKNLILFGGDDITNEVAKVIK